MPEGDVLRRTSARMAAALVGAPLVRAELRWGDLGAVDLVGREVIEVVSYGKHLLVRLEGGRTLRSHLRMEGSWFLARTGTPDARGRGTHVRAVLGNERWTALGLRLGMLDLVATRDEHLLLGHLGPDLLDPGALLDAGSRSRVLDAWRRAGRTPVAEVLLDQGVVAGIGTIWCAESLHTTGTWPWTPADAIAHPLELLAVAQRLMVESVGSPRDTRRVHGRDGQPCPVCREPLRVGSARRPPVERPVYFCPRCQPGPGSAASAPHPGETT